jgi:hypothetical protein
VIPFADGHTRQLPRLTAGPFRYAHHADGYLELALRYAHVPVKQAVIAASALSLVYPPGGIDGYPREAFLADLVREAAHDIRGALEKGAHSVQVDFTEGRLALKLDPSGQLLVTRGATLRSCVPVALVVGCVLSAINEGARIAVGHAQWTTWVQVGLNFVVPFLVSSYGYLTAARVPGGSSRDRTG